MEELFPEERREFSIIEEVDSAESLSRKVES